MVSKYKHIIHKTGSLSGYVLEVPEEAPPEKYFLIRINDDDKLFFYNKDGYLSTDEADASIFKENVARQAYNSLKKTYKHIDIFGRTFEDKHHHIITNISECTLTISSRKW